MPAIRSAVQTGQKISKSIKGGANSDELTSADKAIAKFCDSINRTCVIPNLLRLGSQSSRSAVALDCYLLLRFIDFDTTKNGCPI